MVKYRLRVGSRTQVMNEIAKQTAGGLTKRQLKYNKKGKIVSRKASRSAKKNNNLAKAGYIIKKGGSGQNNREILFNYNINNMTEKEKINKIQELKKYNLQMKKEHPKKHNSSVFLTRIRNLKKKINIPTKSTSHMAKLMPINLQLYTDLSEKHLYKKRGPIDGSKTPYPAPLPDESYKKKSFLKGLLNTKSRRIEKIKSLIKEKKSKLELEHLKQKLFYNKQNINLSNENFDRLINNINRKIFEINPIKSKRYNNRLSRVSKSHPIVNNTNDVIILFLAYNGVVNHELWYKWREKCAHKEKIHFVVHCPLDSEYGRLDHVSTLNPVNNPLEWNYINDTARYLDLNPGESDWFREFLAYYELKCYEWILRSDKFKDLNDDALIHLVSGDDIPICHPDDYFDKITWNICIDIGIGNSIYGLIQWKVMCIYQIKQIVKAALGKSSLYFIQCIDWYREICSFTPDEKFIERIIKGIYKDWPNKYKPIKEYLVTKFGKYYMWMYLQLIKQKKNSPSPLEIKDLNREYSIPSSMILPPSMWGNKRYEKYMKLNILEILYITFIYAMLEHLDNYNNEKHIRKSFWVPGQPTRNIHENVFMYSPYLVFRKVKVVITEEDEIWSYIFTKFNKRFHDFLEMIHKLKANNNKFELKYNTVSTTESNIFHKLLTYDKDIWGKIFKNINKQNNITRLTTFKNIKNINNINNRNNRMKIKVKNMKKKCRKIRNIMMFLYNKLAAINIELLSHNTNIGLQDIKEKSSLLYNLFFFMYDVPNIGPYISEQDKEILGIHSIKLNPFNPFNLFAMTKKDLKYNKQGEIISKEMSNLAKNELYKIINKNSNYLET